MAQFYYDKQIRRFITQIVTVFSYFEVEFGEDSSNNPIYRRVPVTYATGDKMVASILRNNSENTMLNVPAMSVYLTGLDYKQDRMQDPSFVDKLNLRHKKYNKDTGEYYNAPGNAFTVERYMPVPYDLQFNVDIWTSSTEQKLQLLEQILVLFNPDFEIQSTDNYIDWSSLSYMKLENVNYSSRSVPAGNPEDVLDVATLSFSCPIWINPPSKLKKLGVIHSIITSLYNSSTGEVNSDIIDSGNLMSNRIYTTPTGHYLLILNGQASIYQSGGITNPSDETTLEETIKNTQWMPYVSTFGELKNGITQLKLRKDNPDTISEIVGTVSFHASDPTILTFEVDEDTVPSNSLRPIDAIIDPTRSGPGTGGLPDASTGHRYLLLEDIPNNATAWATGSKYLIAKEYDIVEYNGNEWVVAWNAKDSEIFEYVTNLKTGVQYKWNKTNWVKSWEGEYPAGTWSLVF